MVRTSKSSFTVLTFEGFYTSVLTIVTGQFIRSCKLPDTTFPGTLVWFFSGVSTLVSLEVGALCVNLAATGISTTMDSLVSLRWFSIVVYSVHQLVWIV